MRRYFITSCGTGVGKTFVTAALCDQLRGAGRSVSAIKPVVSGYDPADQSGDTSVLLEALGINPTPEAVCAVSPYRYKRAAAPSLAAASEGRKLDFGQLLAFCRREREGEFLLAEGAGGVMAPLSESHTMLDWMAALGWPVILVCGTHLGGMSHALTAALALESRGLELAGLALSEAAAAGASLAETAAGIEKFLPRPGLVVQLPRGEGEAAWKNAPSLTKLVGA